MSPDEIVPRWEWRTFGESFGAAEERFGALAPERVQESDEVYLVSRDSDETVKVRDGLLDVKHLEQVDDDGLEQWLPVMKAAFPLSAATLAPVLGRARRVAPAARPSASTRSSELRRRAREPSRGPASRSTCTSGAAGTRSAAAWPS